MNTKDFKILEAMQKFGGSFASSLAKTARLADLENYRKLKSAFPELWDQYALFVDKNNEN